MSHIPIRTLVQEARTLAKKCWKKGLDRSDPLRPVVVDQFVYDLGGALVEHADHIESLLNDYPDEGVQREEGEK